MARGPRVRTRHRQVCLEPMGLRRGMVSSLGPSKGGSRSLTLCLGHFKEKFSSMNIQPMSKQKFARSELASCVAGRGAPTALDAPGCRFLFRVSQTLTALQPRWLACPLLSPPPGTPSRHREASPNSPACPPANSQANPTAHPFCPALAGTGGGPAGDRWGGSRAGKAPDLVWVQQPQLSC